MRLYFGTRECGQIKKYKNQFIVSELYFFIIPIRFHNSCLIIKNKNQDEKSVLLNKNKLSIYASILRGIVNFIFLFYLIFFFGVLDEGIFLEVIIYTSIILTLLIYVNFYFGKSTKIENKIREIYFKETGFYLLVEWLNEDNQIFKIIYEKLKTKYKLKYDDTNWCERLKNSKFKDSEFSLFFCLTGFEILETKNEDKNKIYKQIIEKLKIK